MKITKITFTLICIFYACISMAQTNEVVTEESRILSKAGLENIYHILPRETSFENNLNSYFKQESEEIQSKNLAKQTDNKVQIIEAYLIAKGIKKSKKSNTLIESIF